jgi:hemerythrin-like domain-containing protein
VDAIQLLEHQHRELEDLFEEFEQAGEKARPRKEQLCQRISDALALHAAIEAKIFYPAARSARTDDLQEAAADHLAANRIIAELLDIEVSDGQFEAKVKVLKEQVEHHVEEEEKELFPRAKKRLGRRRLEELGEEMEELAEELKDQREPRRQVQGKTDHAAPI